MRSRGARAAPKLPSRPSLASWSRARRVVFSTAGGRAQIVRAPSPRSRDSARSEKVIFRSGGVSFCGPLSKFRRQEDQETQSQKD
ncbi:uncharacterized protein LOC129632398 isoform X4 [Bubalus kerabau]|uniref:uncharacterized protein LOC129632398 isoform X4 n=1 Tax=Bubalus carabanensis TaxID=3119969 RepID=UPI00244EECDA|nr:uncharacterized protein LOC129632398 isoform X4 [Bubalus carabanensis]